MRPLNKVSIRWARVHGYWDSMRRVWRCGITQRALKITYRWRTIGADSDFPFNGLEVKQVGEVFCPNCKIYPAPLTGNQIALADLFGYRP